VDSALPEVRYTRSGEVDIAYATLGSGPVDLVLVMGWLTHLEVYWEEPSFRRFAQRLAAFTRLILFDKRGMGLSDRTTLGTLEQRMDDVRAVLDAVGSEHAVLMGISEGAPLSLLFAASHPERTQALVFAGGEVKEITTDDWPWGQGDLAAFEASMQRLLGGDSWGRPARVFFAQSRADDPALQAWFGRLMRSAASPSAAVAFMRMGSQIDVRAVVPSVHVPTLVLHSPRDNVVHIEQARWLAAAIPGARLVELEGKDHAPWFDCADQVLAATSEFITGAPEPVQADTVLATVLFTDLVGSTERVGEVGNRTWRRLLEQHHDAVRMELRRHRGTEIDAAGDGFLARFDGPARAIRCALAILGVLRGLGLPARSGVHTGECELVGGKLAGLAVHVGARVAALAAADEVLVTDTVRDLVAGSGIAFDDRGLQPLKGFTEPRRLFAVRAG
jgi:pimeloyl-ACP methyl ester carboxylesterase